MKTSFLQILFLLYFVVWSLGAQAQRSIDLINDNDRVQLCEIIHRSNWFKLSHMNCFFASQNTDKTICLNVI